MGYYKLNKEYSLKYYEDNDFREKINKLVKINNYQLFVDLSITKINNSYWL